MPIMMIMIPPGLGLQGPSNSLTAGGKEAEMEAGVEEGVEAGVEAVPAAVEEVEEEVEEGGGSPGNRKRM